MFLVAGTVYSVVGGLRETESGWLFIPSVGGVCWLAHHLCVNHLYPRLPPVEICLHTGHFETGTAAWPRSACKKREVLSCVFAVISIIVQELCESRGGRPGPSVLTSLLVSVDVIDMIEPCFGIGHNLSQICLMTSEDIKHQIITRNKHNSHS